jgi:ferredoxin--NADP+ reductase
MFRIVDARLLSEDVKQFDIEAPNVAVKQRAGQFVILRVTERGERIPLTVAGSDAARGTVRIIVQGVGKTTKMLNRLEAGDFVLDVVGPLGRPSEIANFGTAVTIGGGVGTAIAFPVCAALKAAGNRVIAIIGARTKELVMLEDETRAFADETLVVTDDGTYGQKGLVIDPLKGLIERGQTLDYVLAIGPVPMMAAVADVTRPHGIHTVVSLNSIMIDGTGMCGGCRVQVGGETKFACVDGPEFDAHQVDFRLLSARNSAYREAERGSLEGWQVDADGALAEHRETCRLLLEAEAVKEGARA